MGEVLLVTQLHDADEEERRAFADALGDRRWHPIAELPSSFACHFEGGFMDQVRRIVSADVHEAARRAGVGRWHAAHVWSATEPTIVRASEVTMAPPRATAPGGATWTDGGAPVGPVADVLITVAIDDPDADERAFAEALVELRWRSLAPLELSFVHSYDLGMFQPIEQRVLHDLCAAAERSKVGAWRAAWSASTWEHTQIDGPRPPRTVRPLPWDENR